MKGWLVLSTLALGLACLILLVRGNVYAQSLAFYETQRFEEKMGITHSACRRGIWGYDCSGVIAGKPVRYSCDNDACEWVRP